MVIQFSVEIFFLEKKNVIITVINGLWFSPYKRYFQLYNKKKTKHQGKTAFTSFELEDQDNSLPSFHDGINIQNTLED